MCVVFILFLTVSFKSTHAQFGLTDIRPNLSLAWPDWVGLNGVHRGSDLRLLWQLWQARIWPSVNAPLNPGPARSRPHFIPNPKVRLREQCREVLRFNQMARRTETS